MNNKVLAAKNAMADMALYYSIALKEAGYTNTREMIIEGIAEAINLTETEKAKIESSDPAIQPEKVIDDVMIVMEGFINKKHPNMSELKVFLKNTVSCLKYLKTLVKPNS